MPGVAILERIVAAAWHEALGIGPTIDDDFFAIGGHSLAAGEVVARLETVLDIDVPLGMVFDQPTVREQAAWLATVVVDDRPRGVPWREPDGAVELSARAAGTLAETARQQATTSEAAAIALVAASLAERGVERVTIGAMIEARGQIVVAPVVIDLAGDPSFITLVDRARAAVPRGWAAASGLVAGGDAPADAVAHLDGTTLRVPASVAARVETAVAAIAGRPAVALSALLPGHAAAGARESPEISEPLPLTHAQERLWFLETLAPNTTTNHLQRVYRVDGRLDLEAVERALVALAARHPALRTVFRTAGGAPSQLVFRSIPLEHRVDRAVDVAAAHALAADDHDRPFALDRGPLWRTRIIAISPDHHVLVFTIHHLIADAISAIVWLRELAEHIHAFSRGTVPRVPELGTSLPEIAVWERSPEGRARSDADLAWWREQLAGARPLDLPIDLPRPRGDGLGRHEVHEMWSADRAAELRALARQYRTTYNVILFAGAAAFLARMTGRDDFVCVVPAARRDEPGREAVIGLLLNLLPLRLRLDGDPTFGEVIERATRAMRDAMAHAEAPYERVVAALGLPREPGRQPLLDVIVNMVPGTELTRRGELRFEIDTFANSAQPCDLVIGATTRPGGLLDLMIRLRADLFAEITAHRMLRRFAALLDAAMAAPALPLSELPIMPADERALVAEWNRTDSPLPEACVHELVAGELARAPDAIAIVQGARTLSRGELAHRAQRLARHVAGKVAPGTPVGVAIPPSPELAIAALGVMTAGAVYVPLDTAQPAARVEQLAREVAYVIEPSALASDGDAALPRVGPDAPAYMVFTSGSTGRPKAVSTTHRALVNQILWFRRDLPWRPGEVSCMRSSPAFVDSLWELFGPLADGVPLAIATADEMRDPRLLAAMAARHRVTRMIVVPSLLRTLLELGASLPDLTLWLATSEELAPSVVRAFFAARPGNRLVNLYGASETADQVAAYEVLGPEPRTPIGRPIANSRIYVVDATRALVPIGVPGELCVGGVGLSTYVGGGLEDRFIHVAGERVYRTGDRGRWRHDGVLDYLGRLDHQLKIRGVRVDPAEVEAAIRGHDDVTDAVVTAQPGFDREPRLVAHVVVRPGVRFDAAKLRRRLRERLPEPMIPTMFVALAELPLGPTGKVDRAALPVAAPIVATSRAPTTATEHAVALGWEQLLGQPVGAEDDWFAVGGQSLVAAQLGAWLAERFGVELPLPVLFERPTVAAQAAWIDETLRATAATTIPSAPTSEPAPLSYAQERLWFAMQLAPRAPAPKLRSALRIDGPLDRERLARALERVAERQASLRTVFDDGSQRVLARVPRDHREFDLAGVAEDRRDEVVHEHLDEERDRPFDLANGPPWRTRLLGFGPEQHVLTVTMHHLVSDGISLAIWRDDLHACYADLELPPIATSVADLARWQRRGTDHSASLRFWQQQLVGATALDLPLAAPRSAWSDGRGGRIRGELAEAELAALAEIARREQATVFAALVAGAAAWLAGVTRRDDLVIGTIAGGRDRPEARPLVGLFLNPLPIRIDARGDPSLRELVRRAGATTRAVLAHGEVPFERIVAEIHPERRPFRQPLFDVVLNHHPMADPPRLGELRVSHVRGVTAPVAPYELMIRTIARRELAVQLDFQRDRFDDASVADWLARYLEALRAMIADPDRRISTLRA